MSKKRKVDLVMNLYYNLVLAVVLSVLAEIINSGGVTWPAILIDTLISYVLEMLIAMFLPFTKWGQQTAFKHAAPGSVKFRIICATITASLFATLMSLLMSFIGAVLMGHAPMIAWLFAWLKIWFLFIAIAWLFSFFTVPFFIELAKKTLGIPKEYNPFTDRQ